MSDLTEINHLDEMLARLPDHAKGAANLQALLAASAGQYQQLEDLLFSLQTQRTVDAATGAQLDGIGQIFGTPRAGRNDTAYRNALQVLMLTMTKSGEPEAVISAFLQVTQADGLSYTEIYPATIQIAAIPKVDVGDPYVAAFINATMAAVKPAGVNLIITTLDGFTLSSAAECDADGNGPSDDNAGFGSATPGDTLGGGLARVI